LAGRFAFIASNATFEVTDLQLNAPLRDAEALAEVLADPQVGGFEVEQPALDLPIQALRLRLGEFFRRKKPNDLLLLHMSSHGLTDDRGELYIAAADTSPRPDELLETALPASFLSRLMEDSRSRQIVVLLDCCHAAAFAHTVGVRGAAAENVQANLKGRGRAILAASDELGYAFDAPTAESEPSTAESKPSLFTGAVVEGLRSFAADLNQDGRISFDELYDYVRARILEINPAQSPHRFVFLEGDLFIAERPSTRPLVAPSAEGTPEISRGIALAPPQDTLAELEEKIRPTLAVPKVRQAFELLQAAPIDKRGEQLLSLAHELRALGYLPQTERILRVAIETETDPFRVGQARIELGKTLDLLLRVGQAAVVYREACKTGPEPIRRQAWRQLGLLLEERDPDSAIDAYREAAKAGFSEALLWLGDYLGRIGRHAEAVAAYERFLSDNEGAESGVFLALARAAAQSGLNAKATDAYTKAARGGAHDAWLELGAMLEGTGQIPEAMTAYNEAIEQAKGAGLNLPLRLTARKAKKALERLGRAKA
jgi:tetratricopeptide (TPR) repeat protein